MTIRRRSRTLCRSIIKLGKTVLTNRNGPCTFRYQNDTMLTWNTQATTASLTPGFFNLHNVVFWLLLFSFFIGSSSYKMSGCTEILRIRIYCLWEFQFQCSGAFICLLIVVKYRKRELAGLMEFSPCWLKCLVYFLFL